MANNVVVGGNVKGDITSCKIENQTKSVQRNSAFSLQQTTTYMTYDVCNKKVIAEYKTPELTGYGGTVGCFVGVVILLVVGAALMKWLDY